MTRKCSIETPVFLTDPAVPLMSQTAGSCFHTKKESIMQVLFINTNTLDEFPVNFPDKDVLTPEDFQILIGENVYELKPTVPGDVLKYRGLIHDIIQDSLSGLVEEIPVSDPSQITNEFTNKLHARFDALVHEKYSDREEFYQKYIDRAHQELSLAFLNQSTAIAKYKAITEETARKRMAEEYAHDYIFRLMTLLDKKNLPKMTFKAFADELESILDYLDYDPRPHYLKGTLEYSVKFLNISAATIAKNVKPDTLMDVETLPADSDAKVFLETAAMYYRTCGQYLHYLQQTKAAVADSVSKPENKDKTPSYFYLRATAREVIDFIKKANTFQQTVSEASRLSKGSGAAITNATQSFGDDLRRFFIHLDCLMASRESDKTVVKSQDDNNIVQMNAVYSVCRRFSDDRQNPDWFAQLALHLTKSIFAYFNDVLLDEEKATFKSILDRLNPPPETNA